MWILQNKETGELIDPRVDEFALSPSDILPSCDSWDEALSQHSEIDIIDGYAVVQAGDRESAGTSMHQTWESLQATLDAGRTPCGDDEEDGSGRGTCGAADGSVAIYTYRRTDTGYVILSYDRIR